MYRQPPIFSPDEILVYLRKSRADDPSMTVEEVLAKHERILLNWIEENLDKPIPQENYYREVISGESLDSREEMKKLLKRIESPKIKAIWSVDPQRISRGDLEDCGRIIKLLRFTKTMVITPYKIYDLDDEYDRDGFKRELERGNDYLEYFKKIQRRGVDVSIQSGNYIGKDAPYGYNKTKIMVGKKKCPTLEINEDEAQVVRLIFDWYANDGIGATKIAHRLNEMGYRTRFGKLWNKETINTMLNNITYIGKIRARHRVTTYNVVDQEVIKGSKRNPDAEIYDGKHDAIIDEETWNKIRDRKAGHHHGRSTLILSNPLAGLLYCKCGYALAKVNGRDKPRYLCTYQKYCHNASVYADEVIEAICDSLKQNIEDFTVELEKGDDGLYEKHQEHIAFLEKKLAEAERKEIALWEKYTEEGMPKAIFDKLRTKAEEEKKNLESALQKASRDMPVRIDYGEKIARFHEAIDMLNDPKISAEVKNRFLKTIIKRIDYERKPSIRMSAAEAKEKGLKTENGWHTPDFELDIHLLV